MLRCELDGDAGRLAALAGAAQSALDELAGIANPDELCRAAVEVARERLEIERCSLWLLRGSALQGTWGTDDDRHTTDEHAHTTPACAAELGEPGPDGNGPRWRVEEAEHWVLGRDGTRQCGWGWICTTPIRADGRTAGVLYNDAAISGEPCDTVRQEALAIFAAGLARLLAQVAATRAVGLAERRWRLLADRAPLGIVVTDADGRLQEANPAFASMTGYALAELLTLGFADLVAPADEHAERGRLAFLRSGGPEATSRSEQRYRRKDGTEFVASAVSSWLPDADQGAVLTSVEDVTSRRETEEQLRQAVKMEAVGQLAGGVVHDFNNLLTTILGYADILGQTLPGGSANAEDALQIRQCALRAGTIAQQLLTICREQPRGARVVDLGAVVGEMMPMLGRLVGANVVLTFDAARPAVHVVADRHEIEQVVLNLVVNARDAMPSGGSLHVAAFERPALTGAQAVLAVEDTGVGMDPATLARIYEPFFTTKPAGQGTGLGLSTTAGIVAQCRGSIDVDSLVGRGTRFEVRFPAAEPTAAEAATPLDAPPVAPRTATVLVVEDEATVLDLARRVLQRYGYVARCFPDATAALAAVESSGEAFDALLTDVMMPRMSGPDLARHLRVAHPALPIVYMTGYAVTGLAQSPLLGPAPVVLRKPFTPQQVDAALQEALTADLRV